MFGNRVIDSTPESSPRLLQSVGLKSAKEPDLGVPNATVPRPRSGYLPVAGRFDARMHDAPSYSRRVATPESAHRCFSLQASLRDATKNAVSSKPGFEAATTSRRPLRGPGGRTRAGEVLLTPPPRSPHDRAESTSLSVFPPYTEFLADPHKRSNNASPQAQELTSLNFARKMPKKRGLFYDFQAPELPPLLINLDRYFNYIVNVALSIYAPGNRKPDQLHIG